MKRIPRYYIKEDRYGNIHLSNDYGDEPLFFQDQSDKEFIYKLLKKGEKKYLQNGYKIDIKEYEPRASILSEFEWKQTKTSEEYYTQEEIKQIKKNWSKTPMKIRKQVTISEEAEKLIHDYNIHHVTAPLQYSLLLEEKIREKLGKNKDEK